MLKFLILFLRKGLEDKPMVDNSEDSSIVKAKTQESNKVLFQAAITAVVNTIGIGLFTVCAVVLWMWKKQMAKVCSLRFYTTQISFAMHNGIDNIGMLIAMSRIFRKTVLKPTTAQRMITKLAALKTKAN